MSKSGVHFTPQELADVLSLYNLGSVIEAKAYGAGNIHAPKAIIVTDRGKFFLKRRAKGKDDIYHVAFAHTIQKHLEKKGYALAPLIPTKDRSDTALYYGKHTYELFQFVDGIRCEGSPEEIIDAGKKLSQFHEYLADFSCDWKPLRQTYHDSASVRGHLKIIRSNSESRHPDQDLQQIAHELLVLYNYSSTEVNQVGFDNWPQQIVHSDWHPGNMLYKDKQVICVLDFDSVKIAPVITDVANGVLQFSIVADHPSPAQWPSYLDQDKMKSFIDGYQQTNPVDNEMLSIMPDLMIEIMIAEAILPIATTGYFGHHSGLDFLRMIQRKCNWIVENRKLISEIIFH